MTKGIKFCGLSSIPVILPLSSYPAALKYLSDTNIVVVKNQTYDLLKVSKAAIVSSGTATLETAIIGTPQVVCYKTNFFTYQIAKRLVKLKFISLVNLISNKKIVEELIQKNFTVDNLSIALKKPFVL